VALFPDFAATDVQTNRSPDKNGHHQRQNASQIVTKPTAQPNQPFKDPPGGADDSRMGATGFHNDAGAIVLGWLTKLILVLVVGGVVLFDVMAIAYGQVSAADDARQVARIATDAMVLRNASPEEAAELAYSRAQSRGIEVSPEAITVERDGSVTVVIDRDIQTLVAYRIGPIEDYSRVTETYTSPATN
jgi:hypothetical protein